MANDLADQTATAMSYPPKELYEDWKTEAEDWDTSVSAWIQHMVEAGRKQFDTEIGLDEDALELREQRNDLKRELKRTRERVEELEDRLHSDERAELLSFLDDNPGATYDEVTQHIGITVPGRVQELLERLEGSEVEKDGERFYRMGDDE
jgi:hypothetical protein